MSLSRAPEEDLPIPIGGVLAEKYRVERIIGSGGMGVVALGRHLKLGQKVAIKMLRASAAQSPESLERFAREARALSRISSEHVTRVFDVGETADGLPYMVMEYLEGHDLSRAIRENGPLPQQEAVDLVLQACEAIAEAHRIGIVHRDLKPSNLFVARRADGRALVKVLDFGISKFRHPTGAAEELTQSQVMMGSPHYMAPEQLRDARNVDARADIWALGMILFRLASSEMPFDGESTADLCVSVLTKPPRRLAEAPNVLAEVIDRCLQKSPAARFQSVDEFAEALAPVASEEGRSSIARVKGVASNPDISSAEPSEPPPPFVSTPPPSRMVSTPPSRSLVSAATDIPITVHMGDDAAQKARSDRRRMFVLAGALACSTIVLGGMIKLAASRRDASPSSGGSVTSTVAASPVLPPAAVPSPAPVPAAPPPNDVPQNTPAASSTAAVGSAAASVPARTSVPTHGHAVAPPGAGPAAHSPPRPPAASATQAPSKPAPSAPGDDFSAFGRRK